MEFLKKAYFFILDTLQTIIFAGAVFAAIYWFLFRPFQVTGLSMYPTFHDQENVLTDLVSLRFSEPVKGDVVVFVAPKDEKKDYIKRVIGTAGDTVSIQNGDVYVNNRKLDESAYLKNDVKTYGGAFLREGSTATVPPGEYFVIGDNRPYSSDSREWGFVPKDKMIGRSLFVYWPPDRMRLVKNPFK